MRNLKRALSMALAAIMVLGLMVVGASAASYEDFTDKDEIVNTEAVNTMVSLGVISGKEDGSYYAPADSLTRAEACTLIARMLGGGKDPVLGSNITSKFTDTKGHWAETYIAYCANLGIIVGVGDGSFNPDGVLTGTAAAKMVLCALGYKPEFEGIGGANWELATNTLATKVKLYDGLYDLNPSDTISRDDVAQLLYNGVQAQEVEYRNLQGDYSGTLYATEIGTMLTNRFRVVKVTGILEANDKLSVANNLRATNGTQLGHAFGATALEGKSLLRVTNVAGKETVNYDNLMNDQTFTVATPDEMVGQEIVLYVQFQNELSPNASQSTVIGDPIITNNNTVVETSARLKDASAVRSALREGGMSNIGTPVAFLYTENDVQNGVATGITDTISANLRPNVAQASYNERSAGIFQRFIDNDADGNPDYIVQIVPVLTSVNSISTDGEDYTFTGINGTISVADIVTDEELARNDVVLINKYADDCYYVSYPETVEGTVTAFNTNNNNVTVDGTNYANSGGKMLGISGVDQFLTEEETIDNTFIFYLDPAGYVLGYKETAAVIGNYAVVKGFDRSGNTSMGYTAQVKLLMQDGTTATYNLNLAASAVNLGLAAASASTTAKENAITVANYVGDPSIAGTGTELVDHLFSYTVDNGTVTLGRPFHVNDNYQSNKIDENGALLTNSNLDLTKNAFISKNTAEYNTVGNGKIVANDQTVFFVKDTKTDGTHEYYVVTGLSKLPANVTITAGESVSYVAPGTTTQIAKAIFVTSNAPFVAARDYVFVTDKYVRTNTSGTPVYSFTVVYPDGTTGTMETKSNVNTIKNKVCEYDFDNSYANFYPAESTMYNQYYVQSMANNTVTLGNKDTGAFVKSLRVNSNAAIWDVQSDPVADTLSENDVVSLIVDSDGAVKAAFIYDVMNGTFVDNPLKNENGSSITVNGDKLTTDDQIVETALVKDQVIPVIVTIPSTMNAPKLTINDSTTSITMTQKSSASLVAAVTTVTYQYDYKVTEADVARGSVSFKITLSQSGLDSLVLTWTVKDNTPDVDPEKAVEMTVTFAGVTDVVVGGNTVSATNSKVTLDKTVANEISFKTAEGYENAVVTVNGKALAAVDGKYTIAAGTLTEAGTIDITASEAVAEEDKVEVTVTTDAGVASVTLGGTAVADGKVVADKTKDAALVVTTATDYTVKSVTVNGDPVTATNGSYTVTSAQLSVENPTIVITTEKSGGTEPGVTADMTFTFNKNLSTGSLVGSDESESEAAALQSSKIFTVSKVAFEGDVPTVATVKDELVNYMTTQGYSLVNKNAQGAGGEVCYTFSRDAQYAVNGKAYVAINVSMTTNPDGTLGSGLQTKVVTATTAKDVKDQIANAGVTGIDKVIVGADMTLSETTYTMGGVTLEVAAGKTLTVKTAADLGTITGEGNVVVDAAATSEINVGGTVTVNKGASTTKKITADGDITINGTANTAGMPILSNEGNIVINGTAGGASSGTITATKGSVTVNREATATGDITAGTTVTIAKSATADVAISAKGDITIAGSANGSAKTITSDEGNIVIDGTAGQGAIKATKGSVTVNGTANGAITAGNGVVIGEDGTVAKDLAITATAGDIVINGKIETVTSAALDITATKGNITVGQYATIAGAASKVLTLKAAEGTVTVNGDVSTEVAISAKDVVLNAGATTAGIAATGTLTVAGDATVKGAVTLKTFAQTAGTTLTLSGTSASMTLPANTVIDGNITVASDAAANALTIGAGSTLKGTLTVGVDAKALVLSGLLKGETGARVDLSAVTTSSNATAGVKDNFFGAAGSIAAAGDIGNATYEWSATAGVATDGSAIAGWAVAE